MGFASGRRWSAAVVLLVAAGPLFGQPPATVPPPQAIPYATEAAPHDAEPPTAAACGDNPGRFSFDAEYLLMRPRRPAHDFALIGPSNPGNSGPLGTLQSLDWDWSSGFRVGAGARLPDDCWQLGASYTYLRSVRNGAVVRGAGETLFATWTHPGTVEQVDSALAGTTLNYNVFDLEMGGAFHPSEALTVRVFGGPRFAHIDQDFGVTYNGGDANLDHVTSDLHFDGAGFSAGCDADWDFYYGWGLFARGRFSMLLGQFRTGLTETNNAGATAITDVGDTFDKVVPVLELAMGVSWQYRRLCVTAGYELTNWFGLVDMPDFVDDAHLGKVGRRTGDLSLDGLAVRARWDF